MITCDYCAHRASWRFYVDPESWYEATRGRRYADLDEVEAWYSTAHMTRYACSSHAPYARGHVAQWVGPTVGVRREELR